MTWAPVVPRRVPAAVWLHLLLGGAVTQAAWIALLAAVYVLLRTDAPQLFLLMAGLVGVLALVYLAVRARNAFKAARLLTGGAVTTGRLVKTEGFLPGEGVTVVTATFEYQVDGRPQRVDVEDAPKPEWYDFDYATNPEWAKDYTDPSKSPLFNALVKLELSAEQAEAVGEAEKRKQDIMQGRIKVEPPEERILYDPRNPNRALVISVSYPEIEISENSMRHTRPLQAAAVVILPIIAAACFVFLMTR